MSLQEEIKHAIGAHGLWKKRLQSAIETGKSDFSPEVVRRDNNCDFGKGLDGPCLSSTVKQKAEYEAGRRLHAEFHREASNALKLALGGHKEQAGRAMGSNSKFAEISVNLANAMMKWVAANLIPAPNDRGGARHCHKRTPAAGHAAAEATLSCFIPRAQPGCGQTPTPRRGADPRRSRRRRCNARGCRISRRARPARRRARCRRAWS